MTDDLKARLREIAREHGVDGFGRSHAILEAAARIEALEADNEKLRKLTLGQWFYPSDGYGSESCHYSPDEVIEWVDLDPGKHVVEVNVATSLPSIWCAVRVTDDEDADERFTFTEHTSEAEARAALAGGGGE
jgi:hypothetical protein